MIKWRERLGTLQLWGRIPFEHLGPFGLVLIGIFEAREKQNIHTLFLGKPN